MIILIGGSFVHCAIVTGARGFIGSALVSDLLSRGIEVYAVVRRSKVITRGLPDVQKLHVIECNMDEYDSLPEMIPCRDVDVFYHFAWEGSAGQLRSDVSVQLANVSYTVDAVRAAHRIGCNLFCGAGSIMETEANQYIPQKGALPNSAYIYSIAKLTAHYMAKTVATTLNIPFIWGVISNVFGVGEISQRFIVSTVRKLLNDKEADFTEGRQYYDFIYITDIARAFYLLGVAGTSNTSYFLGSGKPMHLRDFIEKMRDTVAPQFNLNFGAVPFNGIYLPVEVFDSSELMRDTGFQPETEFEDGIRKTALWLSKEIEKEQVK